MEKTTLEENTRWMLPVHEKKLREFKELTQLFLMARQKLGKKQT